MPRKLKVVNLEPKEEENNDIEVVNEIVVEDVKVETKKKKMWLGELEEDEGCPQ